MEFLTFNTVCKSFPPIIFLGELFCTFSTDSKSAWNFAFYDTSMKFFRNYFFPFYIYLRSEREILSKKSQNRCTLVFTPGT
jgi:hypothetical protein